MSNGVFVCPGCKARFRVTKAPKSGRIKCPKCGLVSAMQAEPAPQRAAAAPPGAAPAPPAPSVPPPALARGSKIAGHEILAYLGGSAFTGSYKAAQTSMGRTVLFRALHPARAADPEVKAKFFADARAVARLNHPNLLSVFDMGEEGNVCFYTTEFVDGGTLPEFLNRQQKVSSEQRLSMATQIAQALAHAESSGVLQVWLKPESVLLTEKGDVRIRDVGTGVPLEGGTPEPILNALARLVHMAVAGRDLPPEAQQAGFAGPVSLPFPRDPLAGKLNTLVSKLVTERGTTYKTAADFASEIEKLAQGVQRRDTIDTTAPGGVTPIHLARVHQRAIPVTAILVGTIIVVVPIAIGVVLYLRDARAERRTKEAQQLWNKARLQLADSKTLLDALHTFEQLAREFSDTEYGAKANREGIPTTKQIIVGRAYGAAEENFKDKPRETAEAIAAIRAAREELERVLPGYEVVKQQEEVRVKNVHTRYDRAALHEWNDVTFAKVSRLCTQMQFGEAIHEAQGFLSRWPDWKKAPEAVNNAIVQINQNAQKKYDEIVKQVDSLRADNKLAQAEDLLGKVIRNFGIDDYVKKAETLLKTLKPEPGKEGT